MVLDDCPKDMPSSRQQKKQTRAPSKKPLENTKVSQVENEHALTQATSWEHLTTQQKMGQQLRRQ